MYVTFGNNGITVSQLSPNRTKEVKSQKVWNIPSGMGLAEGSRPYKIRGKYYIFVTKPANAEYVLMFNSIWGPYQMKPVAVNAPSPIGGGSPHREVLSRVLMEPTIMLALSMLILEVES